MFKISNSKYLKEEFNQIPTEELLSDIDSFLKSEGVDYVFVKGKENLILKNEFFSLRPGLNWNIWIGVASGEIIIHSDKNMNKKIIKYSVSYLRMVVTLFIIALFGGLATIKLYGIGAILGIGSFILNFPILYFRHKFHLNDIIKHLERKL